MLAGCGVVREKQVNETNSTDNEFTTYRVVNDYIDTEIQVDSANQSSGYGIIYIKYHLFPYFEFCRYFVFNNSITSGSSNLFPDCLI